jgi:hypothetical protein
LPQFEVFGGHLLQHGLENWAGDVGSLLAGNLRKPRGFQIFKKFAPNIIEAYRGSSCVLLAFY